MSIRQNIYFDIDSLLDTRYGVMLKLWEGEVEELDIEPYCCRIKDNIWELINVDRERWDNEWVERGTATLALSRPTELLTNIRSIIGPAVVNGITSPVHERVQIYINTWPYTLTEEDTSVFKEHFENYFLNDADVHMVSIDVQLMKPQFVKENYNTLFMYNFIDWLTVHSKELAENPIPTVSINYPAMFTTTDPELLEEVDRNSNNPFTHAASVLAPYITTEALEVKLFSLRRLPQPL